jgi:predicted methyltransferase
MVREFTDNGIKTASFTFNTVPPELAGTVDRVLMIRALHNLNRFESTSGTRSQALAAVRSMLKDDGLVGVVQHRAPASDAESGSAGSRGYLEEADVIMFFEMAGFELVDTSEINANPSDLPGPEDIVWRLPPSLSTSKDDPELRAKMEAIGESDRMTLLFRKAPQE